MILPIILMKTSKYKKSYISSLRKAVNRQKNTIKSFQLYTTDIPRDFTNISMTISKYNKISLKIKNKSLKIINITSRIPSISDNFLQAI